jgi:hypothetical protein
MIPVTAALKNVFRDNSTIQLDSEVIVENNMNLLIDGITVTSTLTDLEYTDQITDQDGNFWPSGKTNPFKKIFPIDSIIKPFRPTASGIQYLIVGSIPPMLYDPKIQIYPTDAPRMYYPGYKTSYKYWLGPVGYDIDLTVNYKQTTETWAAAKENGTIPSTSGPLPVGNKYAVANKISVKFDTFHDIPLEFSIVVTDDSGTEKTYTSPSLDINWDGVANIYWNGTAWTATNPFETTTQTNYVNPYKIKSIKLNASARNNDNRIAVIELGCSWVKNVSSSLIENINISKQTSSSTTDLLPVGFVNSNSITLTLAEYNKDSLLIKEYNRDSDWESNYASKIFISKNTKLTPYIKTYHSAGYHGTSPNKYDKIMQGIYYSDNWSIDEYGAAIINGLDGSKFLMETLCPDILLEQYPITAVLRILLDSVGFTNYNFNIVNDNNNPDKSVISVNTWWTVDTNTVWQAIQEVCRDTQMNAFFDEAGVLQFYSREFLYKKTSGDWTFRYDPVDYIDYTTTPGTPIIKAKQPNIISLTKQEIASANQVKVLWKAPLSSNYLGNSTALWQAPTTFLAGGGLKYDLPNPVATITRATASAGVVTFRANNSFMKNNVVSISGISPSQYNLQNAVITYADSTQFKVASTATGTYVSGGKATISVSSTPLIVDINSIDNYSKYDSTFNYSGFFLIDSEIIEYDAIEYQYVPITLDDGNPNLLDAIKKVYISNRSDIGKYRYLSKNGYQDDKKPETAYFRPTGLYRIKTRGALGTLAKFHGATSNSPAKEWTYKDVTWTA